jgi:hypothetical protein
MVEDTLFFTFARARIIADSSSQMERNTSRDVERESQVQILSIHDSIMSKVTSALDQRCISAACRTQVICL